MKREFSINYRSQYSKDAAYNQTINITPETLKELKNKLQGEIAHPRWKLGDHYARAHLRTPFGEIYAGHVFTNLTQRDFFNKFLKLKLLDRNTCFCII